MTPIRSPRGTRDILPSEQPVWNRVKEACQLAAQKLNFQEITIPTFEETALFQRSIGDGTDIIDKELFVVRSRQEIESQYALRPEATAGVVRAYIEHGMQTWPQPVKLYSIVNLFRYDRPQRGRFREFFQFNLEYFGNPGPFADAWVIFTQWQVFQTLGLQNITLQLNTLGTSEERAQHREALLRYFTPLTAQLSEDSKRRLQTNPLRILDSKDEGDQKVVANAPELFQFLGEASQQHFQMVRDYLNVWNIPYVWEKLLVRGLDYYSQTCFEWKGQDGLSLGGGGRYDTLISQLGGHCEGAVGAALGLDRIVDLLSGNSYPSPVVDIYVIVADQGGISLGQKLIAMLAQTDLRFDANFSKNSLSNQLKVASKLDARYALIIGNEEANNNQVLVKNLGTGEQVRVALAKIPDYHFV